MSKSFATLRAGKSAERQARVAQKVQELQLEMTLSELRRARRLSQATIAGLLHVNQSSVAKMEQRTDMYLSTLRHFIEAIGGELEVTAKFPDHSIKINQFSELAPIIEPEASAISITQ